MLTITLIRHGKTYGNTLSRYIGSTDEELCSEGIELLKDRTYPSCDYLYISPMIRCKQTASIIYPNVTPYIIENLKECNFGDFENKNYKELADNKDYNAWVLSKATLPFPNGETKDSFTDRTLQGFKQVLDHAIKHNYEKISLVVHGGTIMSILSVYSTTHKDYYDWGVKNGDGYIVELMKDSYHSGDIKLTVLQSITKG
jgi:alpha-ribazole phosphatase